MRADGSRGRAAGAPGRRAATLVLAAAVVLSACGDDLERDGDGRVIAAGPASVFELRTGDCIAIDDSVTGDVDEVPLVPCADPHTQEVFAIVRHPEDAYPGAGAVATFADRACLAAMDAELDLSIDDGVAFSYLLPTFEGWNKNGDRNVVCVLVFPAEPGMTGSFVDGTEDRSRLVATPDPGSGEGDG